MPAPASANSLAQQLDLPKRAIALVLAGGRGSRLKELTDRRAKPAVYGHAEQVLARVGVVWAGLQGANHRHSPAMARPLQGRRPPKTGMTAPRGTGSALPYFGGKFRIVHFALSNCLNLSIRRIGVITQYKRHSLLRHLQRDRAFLKSEMNEFGGLLPAQQRMDQEARYRGTANGGCIVSGQVLRSALCSAVRVHSHAQVQWSVLLPGVEVGRHAQLDRVVVDRGCHLPDGLVIGFDAQHDATRFYRTDNGITQVTAAMLARLAVPP